MRDPPTQYFIFVFDYTKICTHSVGLCSFHVVFVSGSVLSLPLATDFHLFLFLIRIRPDLTIGTQLNFFPFSFWNFFFVTASDTVSPRDKAIRLRHTQNKMHVPLGQFSCTFLLKHKKDWPLRVLHLPAVCPRHDCHTLLNMWLSFMFWAQMYWLIRVYC